MVIEISSGLTAVREIILRQPLAKTAAVLKAARQNQQKNGLATPTHYW
ncbi:MAG: hypothetical protein ACO3NK_00290 [Prochlorotrichaceae cyanobacterium]|jgi:hypothetical protein